MSLEYVIITDTANPLCGLTYEEVLQEVKGHDYALQYVKDQTPELCLAAVKQEKYALQYVNDQYLEYVKTQLKL
jgi:hypothetical protein